MYSAIIHLHILLIITVLCIVQLKKTFIQKSMDTYVNSFQLNLTTDTPFWILLKYLLQKVKHTKILLMRKCFLQTWIIEDRYVCILYI
jgi:ABC-type methionine transport system permease subunit